MSTATLTPKVRKAPRMLKPRACPTVTPPLRDGDRMDADEFLRRWEAMPDLKFAELIEGRVYLAMAPVFHHHYSRENLAAYLLRHYALHTRGCEAGSNASDLLEKQVLQPDAFLRLFAEHGGQSRLDMRGLLSGAPELVIEIAISTYKKDMGIKKSSYERAGVREYIVVSDTRTNCMRLQNGIFVTDDSGSVFKSNVFPGLWLNTDAMWQDDDVKALNTLNEGMATPEYERFKTSIKDKTK